ncbi:MAG: sigma factor-like helix-turn-helix DNA-binding protein [Blautia massiliensis (ex Durand et al. 2017)]|nr:MAG: DNA-binding protein [Subdoligranulum variabile]
MAGKPQKNLAYSVLLDFYGVVLTDKQRLILTEYYDEDLSLAEIAENCGITRQGVRDAIKHGEAALDELEAKLGNARRHMAVRADLERMRQLVMEIRCCNTGLFTPVPQISADTDEMLLILERLDTQEESDGL